MYLVTHALCLCQLNRTEKELHPTLQTTNALNFHTEASLGFIVQVAADYVGLVGGAWILSESDSIEWPHPPHIGQGVPREQSLKSFSKLFSLWQNTRQEIKAQHLFPSTEIYSLQHAPSDNKH